MLIYQQNRGASFCGSFQKFKEMGYSVKRGEHGYQIFVPVMTTLFRADPSKEWERLSDATKAEKEKIKNKEYEVRQVRRYKIGNVFDISQTTCPVEDYPKIFGGDVGYTSEQHSQIFNALTAYSRDILNCPVLVKDIKSITVKGFYRPFDNDITISDRLNDTERLSVMTHELGHAICHSSLDAHETKTPEQIELEADAVSIMLQEYVGVELTDPRKSHVANAYKAVIAQQEASETEPKVTIEDIIQNVSEIYSQHIEGIHHYIENELNLPEKENKTNFFAIRVNEQQNNYMLCGIGSRGNIVNYGEFPSPELAEQAIGNLSSTSADTTENVVLPSYKALQDKVLENYHDNHGQGKPEDLQPPYVHVIFSENASLPDNSFYSIKDAQNIFAMLDQEVITRRETSGYLGYDKTSFQIVLPDGQKYDGRQDFGDGDGGMIDHIQKFWQDDWNLEIYPSQNKSEIQQSAAQLVKTLWDAYDSDYIAYYGKKLEHAQAQDDKPKIVEIQDHILGHLTNKRYREAEFETTGAAHQEPLLFIQNEAFSSDNAIAADVVGEDVEM